MSLSDGVVAAVIAQNKQRAYPQSHLLFLQDMYHVSMLFGLALHRELAQLNWALERESALVIVKLLS